MLDQVAHPTTQVIQSVDDERSAVVACATWSIHGFDHANERVMVKGHTIRLAGDGMMSSLVFRVVVSASAEEPGLLPTLNCCKQKGLLIAPDGPHQWSRDLDWSRWRS